VLLQLVQEGHLDLDAPVSQFGIAMTRNTPVKVWHLLSHTSGDPPGTRYRYDGNAFGRLTQVIERASGQSFARELANRIIRPLGLTHTAPNPGDPHGFRSLFASVDVASEDIARARSEFAASGMDRRQIESSLAQGYARSWGRRLWPTGLFGPMQPMPHGFTLSATAGWQHRVSDVRGSRWRWTRAPSERCGASPRVDAALGFRRSAAPLCAGWFVQEHRGYHIVWHYGHGLESSSLIVKIPDRESHSSSWLIQTD
jgi:CubicO group peptidase (beta-lactamase class C family)